MLLLLFVGSFQAALAYTREEQDLMAYQMSQPLGGDDVRRQRSEETARKLHEEFVQEMNRDEAVSSSPQYYGSLRDRYERDDEFQALVKLSGAGLTLLVILSFLASFVGLSQKVIWAFIGGLIGAQLLEIILVWKAGLGFGFYSFFVSFVVGLGCAYYVQSKN